MSESRALATFAATLTIDEIPPHLLEKAKDHLLDFIGVVCAGLSDPQAERMSAVVRRWGGAPDATLIGYEDRLPCAKAAFLNALHGRVLTFDDTYEAGPSHPGSAVLSAALAAAEYVRASGRDLLSAIVAGYEVSTRVTAALGAEHYGSGFHASGTCAPFGAAAAAGKIFQLSPEQTANAFGLAGEAAIGLRQYQEDGSLLDSALNSARGAELGLAAAEFAKANISGPKKILEGRWGLLRMMAPSGVPEAITADLGTRWEFSSVTLKPYASCRFTHGPIEALLRFDGDVSNIERVEIATFRESYDVSNRPDPQTRGEAIMSHQIAAALALLKIPLMPTELANIRPEVRALAAKIDVSHTPALDALYPSSWPHRISIIRRGGHSSRLTADQPPDCARPEARAKFKALATPVLGCASTEKLGEIVDRLERLDDIHSLSRLLGSVRPMKNHFNAAAH